MDGLFTAATIARPCTAGDLDAAEAALGLAFPQSYRRFCLRFGPGLVGGLYGIATPMPDPADPAAVTVVGPHLDALERDAVAMAGKEGLVIGIDVYEDMDAGVLDRARFFGSSYDGHRFLWDVRPGADEYDIHVAHRYDVRFAARTLDELVRACQTDRVKAILGPGYAPLPATFAMFQPRLPQAG